MVIGKQILRLSETLSTNKFIADLAEKNEIAEGTLVSASHQLDGKGAGNNKWESEKGKNLTVSFILYPSFLPMEKLFLINKIASLGICDMIKIIIKDNKLIKIKWPNDIYVNNKKISGILIENTIIGNTLHRTIIGMGININQENFVSDAPNPVSLKNILGKDFDLDQCLSILCFSLDQRYSQLKNSEYQKIDEDYHNALFRLNEVSSYLHNGKIINASINGVGASGKLILNTDDCNIMECDIKEVEFLL